MELQGDVSIERFRRRIREVHDHHPVQPAHVVIGFYLEQELIPVVGPDHHLVLGRRPDYPLPAVAVDAARVVSNIAVDLKLKTLGNCGCTWFEFGMKEYATIA